MSSAGETSAINQFPQPRRPANSYDLNFQYTNCQPSSSANPSIEDAVEEAMRNEREDIGEDVVKGILKMYHKLPPTISDQLNLEAVLRKVEEKGMHKSKEVKPRGLKGSTHKLHRFKIRTVVAQEDDHKK